MSFAGACHGAAFELCGRGGGLEGQFWPIPPGVILRVVIIGSEIDGARAQAIRVRRVYTTCMKCVCYMQYVLYYRCSNTSGSLGHVVVLVVVMVW